MNKIDELETDEPVIRTISGRFLNLLEPNPDDILIEDIAHGLSNVCRFGGQIQHFYSVAQHSICVANYFINDKNYTKVRKLEALLHDASEAYICDIPSPLKNLLHQYGEIERRLMLVIAEKFGFDYPICKEVKEIDTFQLRVEYKHAVVEDNFDSLPPGKVKKMFLKRYKTITGNDL